MWGLVLASMGLAARHPPSFRACSRPTGSPRLTALALACHCRPIYLPWERLAMTGQKLETDGAALTVYLDAPDWNGAPTAALGAFTCKTAEAGGKVSRGALEPYHESQGIDRVIGPMDGDTWHSYRFVTESDGSPAFILEPPDRRSAARLLRTGFTRSAAISRPASPAAGRTTGRTGAHGRLRHRDMGRDGARGAVRPGLRPVDRGILEERVLQADHARRVPCHVCAAGPDAEARADLLRPPPGRIAGRDSCSASRTTRRARPREPRS
jgi:hypothetical protein